MDLYQTPGNPIPPGAIVSAVRTRDGKTLRVARWSLRDARGTVSIAIGRSEFIEQYCEIIQKLLDRRLDVVIMDWRGQGQSDREIAQGRRGYVSSFAAYRRDLDALESQILRPYAVRPWFGLGHSMGGAILLGQAHDGESPFERLFLSAPMIGLPLRFNRAIRWLTAIVDRLGFGPRLIPGGSEDTVFSRGFENNVLTSDLGRYTRLASATTNLNHLAVGAPTIRWLAQAYDLMDRFAQPRYAVETLTPILIVAAGADHIVDTATTERFALQLKAGRCLTIPGARHQIIMERESIVAQVWAAFDAFIPGEAVAPTPADAKSALPA
jgi:lysophospholipase